MATYRVRLNAYNPWHPEYGTVQVVLRVRGYDLDDALNGIRSVHMTDDGSRVTSARRALVERQEPIGPGYSFPCWDIVGRPRAVKDDGADYLVKHVKPIRTIASVGR